MTRSLIVAMSRNGVIGQDGKLPWHLPDDLRRFKQITMGHHLIMGRKTFESIGRVLPGRTTIVLTTNPSWQHAGVEVAHSLDEAWRLCGDDAESFVVGGGEIYRLALPLVDRLYVTRVETVAEGDTQFPALDAAWSLVSATPHPADERHANPLTYEVYERVTPRQP